MEEPRAVRRSPATERDGGSEAEIEAGVEGLGFEAALDELERLVDRLEDGDLALEQALVIFERGVTLSRRCAELLECAERRIEILARDGAGLEVRAFEKSDASSDESEGS